MMTNFRNLKGGYEKEIIMFISYRSRKTEWREIGLIKKQNSHIRVLKTEMDMMWGA